MSADLDIHAILAYADPPYPGQAKKHYSHDPKCAEVDHEALLVDLDVQSDGWALSTSSTGLQYVMRCAESSGVEGIRVAAWVKPFASFKPGVNPGYCWEPVLFKPARNPGRRVATVRDWLACSITLKKGLAGAKPPAFCFWLFDLLGAQPGDEFQDWFPGTGIVGDCWQSFCGQPKQGPLL